MKLIYRFIVKSAVNNVAQYTKIPC